MDELVTIIIPVYKVEKFLRRCLDSVRCQTYQNIEVILVDDGSPDACPAICDDYAAIDERFHVIHKPNGGLSSARNAGMDLLHKFTRGGYIFFVDSDDFLPPEIVEECVKAIEQRNRPDAVVFGARHTFLHGEQVLSCEEKIPDRSTYNCSNFQEVLRGPLHNMFGIPAEALQHGTEKSVVDQYKQFLTVWSWFFRKDVCLENSLRFHEDLICGEDHVFVCEFLAHCNTIASIETIGYEYMVRTDGMVKTRILSPKIADNKIRLVHYRNQIQDCVLQRSGQDIASWTYGSYVLSIFQLCVALAGEKDGYRKLKEYTVLEEVRRAVKQVPLKGKPKLVLPLLLCKLHCYRIMYCMIAILKRLGFSVAL